MTKEVKRFKANYNGEAIKDNEVMIPFVSDELDVENCVNAECIKGIKIAGRVFKVIYKAVPKGEPENNARKIFNYTVNEALGHYCKKKLISMDYVKDVYDLDLGKVSSAEDIVISDYEMDESFRYLITLLKSLIEKFPKIGYATLLMANQIKGEEFYRKMMLSRNAANKVQQQVKMILSKGTRNIDFDEISCYKSPHDNEYRVEAYKLLDKMIAKFR